MNFSQMLKDGRKRQEMTLTEAANLFGISVSYLSEIENNLKQYRKMDFIYKAANIYGMNSDILCLSAERVPTDVFNKLVKNPQLLEVIRNYKA
jgi:transcriptional regulator with XRE-family HTH domain